MAKKFDGVIEAVRYDPDGQIVLVRGYLLRGVTYSDRVLLDRDALMEKLKKGKKFTTGQRKEFLASTFEVGKPLKAVRRNGGYVITTKEEAAQRDEIEGAPVF